MNEREHAAAGGFPTRKSLELTLPDDVVSLKRITAELMVERAMLERELELVKKDGGVVSSQLSHLHKTQTIESLHARFPLTLLLRQAGLRPSSYQYCKPGLARPRSHGELRLQIRSRVRERLHVWISSHLVGAPQSREAGA